MHPKIPKLLTLLSFVAAATCSFGSTLTVPGHSADTEVRNDGSFLSLTAETLRVGGTNATLDAAAVYLFALPEIPEGHQIMSASLEFTLIYIGGGSNTPADLYGLPVRSSPAAVAADFYQGTFGEDPGATGLQDDIMVASTPAGRIKTSESGSLALRDFIAGLYMDGAEAGDYAALRLNVSALDAAAYSFYNLATANHSNTEYRPALIIETFDGNFSPLISAVDIVAVEEGSTVVVNLTASDENPGDALVFSSDDLPPFATLDDAGDGSATIEFAPEAGDAAVHIFTVSVSDGKLEASTQVVVAVNPAGSAAELPQFGDLEDVQITQGDEETFEIVVDGAAELEISAFNLPEFVTFEDMGDGSAVLAISPSYYDAAGSYSISLLAVDGSSLAGVAILTVEVLEKEFEAGYYCDPINGSITNDGGPRSPWGSLAEVMSANKQFAPGDKIFLRDGYHGEPALNGANEDYVYILAEAGATPAVSLLTYGPNSAKWHVSGLSISRSHAPTYSKAMMVTMAGSGNVLSGSTIFSRPDITGWTADDWNDIATSAVTMSGTYGVLEDCTIIHTNHAVQTTPASSFNTIRRNHIQHFSGDGIRAIGNDQLVEYNFIADCYKVNDNHDDGIQGWSVGEGGGSGTGVSSRITIRGNYILETTDTTRPLRGPMQGIGCFDGMFEDWVVENNIVIVNQWHGIAFYGAINCKIINNTVVDMELGDAVGPTWITIEPHKNYSRTDITPEQKLYYRGRDNVVRNNVATGVTMRGEVGVFERNMIVREIDMPNVFVDYPLDLRLKAGSPAIDIGLPQDAPAVDALGTPRPAGAGIDLGAYEWVNDANWAGFPVDAQGWANTGSFFGWLYVGYAPWHWQAASGTWIYVPDVGNLVSEAGAWLFSLSMTQGPAQSESAWAGYVVGPDGWFVAPLGQIYTAGAPWFYVSDLDTWTYMDDALVSDAGAWLYAFNLNR